MAVAITGTPNVQSNTASGSDKTLTFTSTTYGAGEVLVVCVGQNAPANYPQPGVPSGGGLTWTQIFDQSNTAGNFSRATAWWATTGAGGTYSVTQTTTRLDSAFLSTRGVLYRLTGANTTTPVGATDGHSGTASDPLVSNTNLQLTTASAGAMLFAAACDWSASTDSVAFDSGLTATTDINAVEAGEATFIAFRSDALAADDSDVRAEMDAAGGTGNWAAIFFEIEAAAGGATPTTAPPPDAPLGPGSTGPMAFQWSPVVGSDTTPSVQTSSSSALLSAGVAQLGTVAHVTSARLTVGAAPLSGDAKVALSSARLDTGVTELTTVTKTGISAARLDTGATERTTATKVGLSAALLSTGVAPRGVGAHATSALLETGVTERGTVTKTGTGSGRLDVGANERTTATKIATSSARLDVGISERASTGRITSALLAVGTAPAATVTKTGLSAGRLDVGTTERTTVAKTGVGAARLGVGPALLASQSVLTDPCGWDSYGTGWNDTTESWDCGGARTTTGRLGVGVSGTGTPTGVRSTSSRLDVGAASRATITKIAITAGSLVAGPYERATTAHLTAAALNVGPTPRAAPTSAVRPTTGRLDVGAYNRSSDAKVAPSTGRLDVGVYHQASGTQGRGTTASLRVGATQRAAYQATHLTAADLTIGATARTTATGTRPTAGLLNAGSNYRNAYTPNHLTAARQTVGVTPRIAGTGLHLTAAKLRPGTSYAAAGTGYHAANAALNVGVYLKAVGFVGEPNRLAGSVGWAVLSDDYGAAVLDDVGPGQVLVDVVGSVQ